MRITEGQLRTIVRSIIREGTEVDEFLAKFQQNCRYYGDADEVAAAFKETAESKKGGVSPEQQKVIDKYAEDLKNSPSLYKNFSDSEKGAVQGYKGHMGRAREKDSPTHMAIQNIEDKVKAAAARVLKAM